MATHYKIDEIPLPLCDPKAVVSQGVEELLWGEETQMEFPSNLETTLNDNLEFGFDLDDTNWNEILPTYSENSVLKTAHEELNSSATSPGDLSFSSNINPAPTNFSEIPPPLANNDMLSDFEDLEKFFSTENLENLQLDLQEKITEPISIIETDNKCLDSVFLENAMTEFPNVTNNMDDEKLESSSKVVTLESDVLFQTIYNEAETNCPTIGNNFLEELMFKSGIKNEAEFDNKPSCRKRTFLEETTSIIVPAKSPKLSENDSDDTNSVYSSSVSSPEDNKIIERRKKNNLASKVSRYNRKTKHQQLFEKEKHLTEENARLRILIEEMTKEATEMRNILVLKLSESK